MKVNWKARALLAEEETISLRRNLIKIKNRLDKLIDFFEDESMQAQVMSFMCGKSTKSHSALAFAFREFRKEMFE